jgi:hypothetical protein
VKREFKEGKLSLKTARELALKVLGTAKGLTKNEEVSNSYEMKMGKIFVQIQNDWYGSGCISVSIDNHFVGNSIFMLFNAETLEEDNEAEDSQRNRWLKEEFESTVYEIGLDGCREIIEKIQKGQKAGRL